LHNLSGPVGKSLIWHISFFFQNRGIAVSAMLNFTVFFKYVSVLPLQINDDEKLKVKTVQQDFNLCFNCIQLPYFVQRPPKGNSFFDVFPGSW